jgi:hypothetical protein
MLEPPGDSRQIADAVAIRVSEGSRIDLIEDGALPPGWLRLIGHGALVALVRRIIVLHRATT